MLSWVALDTDLARLTLVLTRSWCKLKMLSGSLEEKNLIMALVGLRILVELGVHPIEDEHVVLRQPHRPRVPF